MTMKATLQVLFYMQVARIAATGSDDSQRKVLMLLNTLENLDTLPEVTRTHDTNTFDRPETDYPHYMKNIDKDSRFDMFDMFQTLMGRIHSYHRNIIETKPKRGWEDLNMAWRRSPKRAWEVINKLWRKPDIRRRYKNYQQTGKRSEELLENIPVQQGNVDPTWMIDEIGYDIDFNDPVVENGPDDKHARHLGSKRGWEDIGPFRGRRFSKNRSLRDRNSYTDTFGKRGWEDIAWKRETGVKTENALHALQKKNYNYLNDIDFSMVPNSDERTNGLHLTNLPPDMIKIENPDNIGLNKDRSFDKQLKRKSGSLFGESDVFENYYDKQNFPDDLHKLDQDYKDLF